MRITPTTPTAPTMRLTRGRLFRAAAGTLAAGAAGAAAACGVGPAGGSRETPAEVAGKVTMWTRNSFRFDEDTGAEIMRDLTSSNPRIQVDAQVLVEDDVAGRGENQGAPRHQVHHPADGGDDDKRAGA